MGLSSPNVDDTPPARKNLGLCVRLSDDVFPTTQRLLPLDSSTLRIVVGRDLPLARLAKQNKSSESGSGYNRRFQWKLSYRNS